MTEETKTAEHIADPAERAKANGYVEPAPPSREERVKAVITALDHAAKHNSPIDRIDLAEIKDLLAPAATPVETE